MVADRICVNGPRVRRRFSLGRLPSESASGRLESHRLSLEEFVLDKGEKLCRLAFAARVGAFGNRHPEVVRVARGPIRQPVRYDSGLFIDGGNPLGEIKRGLPNNRLKRLAFARR